jgi:hypothetical protein
MIRVLQIAIMSDYRAKTLYPRLITCIFLGFCLMGCNGGEELPIWEQVKIRDLVPIDNNNQADSQRLKTINFNVHIFEIPSDEISALDKIWPTLYTQPLRFNNPEAFSANSFRVGFGQIPIWNRVANTLSSVDGIQAGTFSLLIPDGQSNDIAIAALGREQTVFYTSNKGTMEGAKFGRGRLGLQIQAEKMAGARGVCRVSVLPVISASERSKIALLSAREKSGEFLFESAGFRLNISPGDFVLLGPEKYESGQTTLSSLLFSKPEGSLFFNEHEHKPPELREAVRLFLIVCTSIN